ncbi:MAG: MalY/PatB family protein [Bifidobacterium psychraerophilum]|uniref:MalY/PatB family protein n=1 Tax=Bifidobacterium psychraerophilum TaxID=218140 RepID=UPI0039E8306C
MYDFDTVIDHSRLASEKWAAVRQDMGPNSDDVLALSVADMEFTTAPEIIEALHRAVDGGVFGYEYCTDAYYEALQSWMSEQHHWNIRKEWITPSDGVMTAVFTALRAVTHPGDAVIIQRPVYYPFTNAALRNGLTILNNELVQNAAGRYEMDYEDLERKASEPRCTAMILCNPHNPVGRVWSAEELRRLADICVRHGVTILADEIHADFAYPGHEVTMFSTLGEDVAAHCMEFTAPSKTFNLAGLITSNVVIPDAALRRSFGIAADNVAGLSVNHFGLVACQAAYEHGADWLNELRTYLNGNLEVLREFASGNDAIDLVEPEGTYLAWLDCRKLKMSAEELRDFMRYQARVYFDEGVLFGDGGAGFERVNIACPRSMLERACEGVEQALKHR